MINKDMLIKYVRIISGYDADPNLTLVDFSLNEEQRNIVNFVNEEAKKDKNLAMLLDDLKYSNNKNKLIEDYFNNLEEEKVEEVKSNLRFCGREINSYGFINSASLIITVEIVVLILSLFVRFASK